MCVRWSDICLLIHTRKGNVAKSIGQFGASEKARMAVICPRSDGTVSTHVLTVLSVSGLRRLLASSRSRVVTETRGWMYHQLWSMGHPDAKLFNDDGDAAALREPAPAVRQLQLVAEGGEGSGGGGDGERQGEAGGGEGGAEGKPSPASSSASSAFTFAAPARQHSMSVPSFVSILSRPVALAASACSAASLSAPSSPVVSAGSSPQSGLSFPSFTQSSVASSVSTLDSSRSSPSVSPGLP